MQKNLPELLHQDTQEYVTTFKAKVVTKAVIEKSKRLEGKL